MPSPSWASDRAAFITGEICPWPAASACPPAVRLLYERGGPGLISLRGPFGALLLCGIAKRAVPLSVARP